MPRTKDAKPAEIVKCPYCEHKGSARGLYSHIRLAHPGMEKSVTVRRVNPHSINKAAKVGSIPTKGKKVSNDVTMQDVGLALLVGTIFKLIENYFAQDNAKKEMLKKFQREGHKLNRKNPSEGFAY